MNVTLCKTHGGLEWCMEPDVWSLTSNEEVFIIITELTLTMVAMTEYNISKQTTSPFLNLNQIIQTRTQKTKRLYTLQQTL